MPKTSKWKISHFDKVGTFSLNNPNLSNYKGWYKRENNLLKIQRFEMFRVKVVKTSKCKILHFDKVTTFSLYNSNLSTYIRVKGNFSRIKGNFSIIQSLSHSQ
jgi:hypothetical protein